MNHVILVAVAFAGSYFAIEHEIRGADDGRLRAFGVLESVNSLEIRSPFQATILELAQEGKVKKGDLLVRLETTSLEEAISAQSLAKSYAQAALAKTENDYESAVTRLNAAVATREAKLQLAELARELYLGKFEIERQAATTTIELAEKRLGLAKRVLARLESQRNLVTAIEIEEASIGVMEREAELSQATASLTLLLNRMHPFHLAEVELARDEVKRELANVKTELESTTKNLNSEVAAKQAAYQIQSSRHAGLIAKIQSAQIVAPQDGFMQHSRIRNQGQLQPGMIVRERQTLVRFPDLTKLHVRAVIPERQIRSVQVGQEARLVFEDIKQEARGRVTHINESTGIASLSVAEIPEGAKIGTRVDITIDIN